MTAIEIREIIAQNEVHEAVSSIGDRFVSSTLINVESFWEDDDVRRELYSLLALLHHANNSGLIGIIDYNEELWLPVISYASKLVNEFDIPHLSIAISQFEKIIALNMKPSSGVKLPQTPIQMRQYQEAVMNISLDWLEKINSEIVQHSETFVGSANGLLTEEVARWMNINAEKIAPLID